MLSRSEVGQLLEKKTILERRRMKSVKAPWSCGENLLIFYVEVCNLYTVTCCNQASLFFLSKAATRAHLFFFKKKLNAASSTMQSFLNNDCFVHPAVAHLLYMLCLISESDDSLSGLVVLYLSAFWF